MEILDVKFSSQLTQYQSAIRCAAVVKC